MVREARGENKVYLRMDPPTLDECEDFEVFKNCVTVWKAGTAYADHQQAAAVIAGISDDLKYYKKGLKTDLMRTMTEEELKKPTMKGVMDFLEQHLAGTKEEATFTAYVNFMECEMKAGEKYEDFVIRFDIAHNALKQKDKDVKVPDKLLAMQLMRAAKLDKQTIMAVRANVKMEGDDIYKNTAKTINRICHGETNKNNKVAQVKLATEDGTYEITREDGCFMVDGEKLVKQSEAFAATEKTQWNGRGKRGNRAGKRGSRGRGGRGGAETGDRNCWGCGKPGHVQRNCPDNGEDDDGDECKLIGHHAWKLEVEGTTDTEQVILEDEEIEQCFVGLGSQDKTFTQEAAGAAALDSCCSRSLMGEKWLAEYKRLAPKEMRKQLEGPLTSDVVYTFGDGKKLKSKGKYVVPVMIHGVKVKLVSELVHSDIPLLMSKTAMERCGIKLDFADKKVTAFGKTQKMTETSLGHPIIGIIPKNPAPFNEEIMLVMGKSEEEEVMAVKDIKLGKKDSKRLTDKQQREVIKKVHKQAGHQSKEKFLKFLQSSTVIWNKKLLREELENITKNCEGCILKRKKPDKPAACIPVADGFNQCVGMDLKIYADGTIILYLIDMWSKLMTARIVKSKKSEDIISAILESWIAVYGCFDRTIHDNGGEFISAAFQEMTDLLGIEDGTSGAHSPWSCGVVEKHHAVVDSTFEALRRDFPHYKKETLLQWAVYVKNSTPSATGWSSYQIVYGRNPKMPCLMTSNIAGLREEVITEELLENLNALQRSRMEYNRALADNRLKKMIRSKVRRNQAVFKPGDHVYWRAHNTLDKWRQGKALAVDGKVMWIRAGSRIYRVSTDMAVKTNTEFDPEGELVDEEEEREEHQPVQTRSKTNPKKVKFDVPEYETEDHLVVRDDDHEEPDTSGDTEDEGDNLEEDQENPTASLSQTYDNERVLQGLSEASPQVGPSNTDRSAANSRLAGTNDGDDDVFDDEETTTGQMRTMEIPADQDARRAMIRTELTEAAQKRKTMPSRGKTKPLRVDVKKTDVIIHDGKVCDVGKRIGKVGGKNYNTFNVFPRSGKPYSVDLSRVEFQKLENNQRAGQEEQVLMLAGEECHMDIIPYRLHGNQECVEAKRQEIKKIVEDYKAVKVVKDDGHYKISSRFVLWYKKHSDGSVQTRARLVARGFEEKQEVAADSPTMDVTSLKIIFGMAETKRWRIMTADVKAAFLQGLPLTDRTVRVIPPPEAEVPAGHVWELQVALYGLQDASLRFHWKVCKVFKELGAEQSRLDPAVFYFRDGKTGQLKGVIGTHVDDFLITGEDSWRKDICKKIAAKFELGKIEDGDFLYCGHRIVQTAEKLVLKQEEFAEEIKPFNISPERKRESAEEVTDKERGQIRSGAGKLGWIARLTRPDLIFAQIEASSMVTTAKVSDLKRLNKAMMKVKDSKSELAIPKLDSDISKWRLQLFTDAAWQNLNQVGSTGGRVVFITDGKSSYAVHWAAHRLRRVCHSSQAAEIMAMNEGLNDTAFIRQMIHEMTGHWVPIMLTIDNQNAYRAITSNTAPTDKKVRCEAAGVREALMEGEVEKIRLVKGKAMLADVLTKRKVEPNNLLYVVQTGVSLEKLGY